jgi:prepilin-type N-terminal cleavage/methylation domain-containing protein
MYKRYYKGFTLIETLVAISIIMIAIAGPLTVANKAYTSSINAREQSVAMYLAQESMEYINNMKDNRTWGDWESDTNFRDTAGSYFSEGCVYGEAGDLCTAVPGLSALPAGFGREYYLDLIIDDPVSGHINLNQILAVVDILWNNSKNKVRLTQILSNYPR